MQKFLWTALIIVMVSAVSAFTYSWWRDQSEVKHSSTIEKTDSSQSELDTAVTITSTGGGELIQTGKRYQDNQGMYSLYYPAEYTLDTTDPLHMRLYKNGPTQRGQTEMYDGVLLVFETLQLEGKSLEQWVDADITAATASDAQQLVDPKMRVKSGENTGYRYRLRGLGEYDHIVLQKDMDSDFAVSIITSVNDPTERGFQLEVNTILSTLELLK